MAHDTPRKASHFFNLDVEVVKEADEQLIRHLSSTVLGTPGGLQYRHTTVRKKLDHLRNIRFMLLKKSGHLLGSVGLVQRTTRSGTDHYQSWYVRYFSIRAPLRSKKHQPERAARDASRSAGLLKSVALPYFENPGLLEEEQKRLARPGFLYAYIERANYRSLRFSSDMGLRTFRKFTTVLFSRIRLQIHKSVRRALPGEYNVIEDKLTQFYAGHTMFYPGNLFIDGHYFVYIRNGKMVAGLQVHPDAWKIEDREGVGGWFLLDFLPRIPGVRKIFNPAHFRFLAVEGIWYDEGREELLQPLLESACAHLGIHIAMMWFDTGSPVLHTIDKNVNTGIFGKLVKRTEAEIRIRLYDVDERKARDFKEKPAYISAFDMI